MGLLHHKHCILQTRNTIARCEDVAMARRSMGSIWAALLGGYLTIHVLAALAAQEQPVRSWVELTAAGPSIRAISQGAACPTLSVDGKPLAMQVRATPDEAFPTTVCQALAPKGARSAQIGGRELILGVNKLARIVVIGDTGCRLKGAEIQDCNDPRKWPFSLTSQHAAEKKPDLVLHVGDYYYRESMCPPDQPGCAGSPHGDNWESWRADFFDPASALLAAAPWVFARGNHELCGRGAEGWFRSLDAGETPLTCPATSAPFTLSLPGLRINVIDSAGVRDDQLSKDRLAFYVSQLANDPAGAQPRPKGTDQWLLTHKPLWGYELTDAGAKMAAHDRLLFAAATALDRPSAPQLPDFNMLVDGHVHFFAAIDFTDGKKSLRPAQLIVGDSGTKLDPADARSGEKSIDGLRARYTVKDTFGYFLLERQKKGWKGTLYGAATDEILATCTQQARGIACVAPAK